MYKSKKNLDELLLIAFLIQGQGQTFSFLNILQGKDVHQSDKSSTNFHILK